MDDGLKKCPFCAETIKTEAVVCKYCGKKLQSKSSGSQIGILLIIIGVALIAFPFIMNSTESFMMTQNTLLCWGPGALLLIFGFINAIKSS